MALLMLFLVSHHGSPQNTTLSHKHIILCSFYQLSIDLPILLLFLGHTLPQSHTHHLDLLSSLGVLLLNQDVAHCVGPRHQDAQVQADHSEGGQKTERVFVAHQIVNIVDEVRRYESAHPPEGEGETIAQGSYHCWVCFRGVGDEDSEEHAVDKLDAADQQDHGSHLEAGHAHFLEGCALVVYRGQIEQSQEDGEPEEAAFENIDGCVAVAEKQFKDGYIEVEVRSPKVPMTSDTEETAMANVSQNPDFRTDSSAKLIPK